jgi:hypothetical protein
MIGGTPNIQHLLTFFRKPHHAFAVSTFLPMKENSLQTELIAQLVIDFQKGFAFSDLPIVF